MRSGHTASPRPGPAPAHAAARDDPGTTQPPARGGGPGRQPASDFRDGTLGWSARRLSSALGGGHALAGRPADVSSG